MSKINKRSFAAELIDLRTIVSNGCRLFRDSITFPVGDRLEIVRRGTSSSKVTYGACFADPAVVDCIAELWIGLRSYWSGVNQRDHLSSHGS